VESESNEQRRLVELSLTGKQRAGKSLGGGGRRYDRQDRVATPKTEGESKERSKKGREERIKKSRPQGDWKNCGKASDKRGEIRDRKRRSSTRKNG